MATAHESSPNNSSAPDAAPDNNIVVMTGRRIGRPYNSIVSSPVRDISAERGLLEHWHILWRRRGLFLAFVLSGLLIGIGVTIYEEPTYLARTTLEFQPRPSSNFLRPEAVEEGFDESAIVTYQQVLRSRSLRHRVVQRLKNQPPTQLSNMPQRSSLLLLAIERLGLTMGVPPYKKSYESALAQAAQTLKAKAIPQTRIVEITCESALPTVAAAFANGLVNEFMDEDLQSHWNSTQSTNKQLTDELQQLRLKMDQSQRALNDYAEKNGITLTSTDATLLDDKVKTTQQDLTRAENDRVAKEVAYTLAQTNPPDSVLETITDPVLRQYTSELNDLKRQLADVSSTFTPAYFKVKAIQAQIHEVEQSAAKERANAVKRLRAEYDEAVRREAMLAATYQKHVAEATSEARLALQYGMLKNDFDANRQIYETVSRRMKELDISSAVHTSNIRVIDTADPPQAPDRPNPVKNLGFGILSGILCGIAVLLCREYLSATIWAPGETPSMLHVPELGVIPSYRTETRPNGINIIGSRTLTSLFRAFEQRPRELSGTTTLSSWDERTSFTAELFRRTVASILFTTTRGSNPMQASTGGSYPKLVVVTSPERNDGKSLVCSNLAIAFAEISFRVLIVDCDLRKPTLHKHFDVANTWGVSNLLAENTDIDTLPSEALCRKTKIPGLYILTSGPPPSSVSQMMFSSRLHQLMLRCRREFDMVLVDTPPFLQVADARALSHHSDGSIVVLRAGRSTVKAAIASTQTLLEDGSRIFGTILNDWDPRASGKPLYSMQYQFERAL
jgi:succinoglycan biosynthesis transport protein ExoP